MPNRSHSNGIVNPLGTAGKIVRNAFGVVRKIDKTYSKIRRPVHAAARVLSPTTLYPALKVFDAARGEVHHIGRKAYKMGRAAGSIRRSIGHIASAVL